MSKKTPWWFWPSSIGIGVVLGLLAPMSFCATPGKAVAQDASPDPRIDATWEIINYSGKATVRRTRVPTGWLIIIESSNTSDSDPMMVPDPRHEWLNTEAELTTFGAYVAADRDTYDALIGDLENYKLYVLKAERRAIFQRTLESWKARIEAAEKGE